MSDAARLRQVWMIARLQLMRVFFSKRSIWVYLLALFPAVIFLGHGVEVKWKRERWGAQKTPEAALQSIRRGDSDEEVLRKAGTPVTDFRSESFRRHRAHMDEGGGSEPERRYMMFFDGANRWDLRFENGILQNKRSRPLNDLDDDRQIYAGVFQYFYLRLAIFFGCLGIFMNLFRGEMLDKTLHYWFLIPVRREVLLAGKYLAGLMASVLIFGTGAVLSFVLMLWPQDEAQLSAFWQAEGAAHLFWYAAAAGLACAGYGSVFLASGLLLRNPILPAVVILAWESINGILPSLLQKLSVLYYVQALCPTPPPVNTNAPLLVRLLSAPAEPPPAAVSVLGVVAVTAVVLWLSARAVRRLEINYGVE